MSFWRFALLIATAHAQQCVTKQTISPGDGVTFPKTGDTVSMQYTGTLASTGAKFDSSRDRGKEFSTQIGVGRVIDGWDQGVPQMSLGERAFLRISAACGYGAQGSPPTIPANADLVFDVELLGINGKRASTGAAVASLSTPSSAAVGRLPSSAPLGSLSSSTSLSGSASFGSAPLGTAALPSCTASSCGHAISFDAASTSKPLCLCNPICVDWANQPGILPCCPGLQEVCLNPLLNKQSSAAAPAVNAAPANSVNAASSARSAPAVQSASSVAPAASALPTCRPNSCGKAMALGLNSLTAVCACDASCLVAGSSLPCCQSFREVCQSAPVSSITSQSQLAGSSAVSFGSQQQPSTSAQQSTASVQQSASLSQSPASQTAAKPLASFPSATSVACTLGKTKWAEQKSCDKKRYAIQNNKCNKVCPPTDPQASANIKTWPTGQPGKQACAAALALCKGS